MSWGIKLFGLNNLAVEAHIQEIERRFDIDVGHRRRKLRGINSADYPQFPERVRRRAEAMARHYAIFYCLENYIRELIVSVMLDVHGVDWFDLKVPPSVKQNAEKNRTRELGTGTTVRSNDLIDYVNFGELGEIIKSNWDVLGDNFRDVRAVERILNNLNTLRAPIAHCNFLTDDEVSRLELSLRDWFRQMA